ncbi:MAG: dTDP-4-dehydrorhamnose 3,5-epimerase [Solirubrobacteraceae bacterium]
MDILDSTVIPGLKRILLRAFRDERGHFVETYNVDDHSFVRPDGSAVTFVEDDVSVSRRHVLRGLHGDDRTYKLVACLHGALWFVVADLRRDSPAHLRWEAFDLSGGEPQQLLIPAGCAAGFVALEEPAILAYKQSERYRGEAGQFTVRWDDPALGISWPLERPLLSARDASAPDLRP